MSLPDMIEWAEEHPDRAAVRIAELERENAALRRDVYQCPPTSENSYEGFKWSDACEELEREVTALRNEIARLNGQTVWVCACGGTDCAGQKENAALREALDDLLSTCEAQGFRADLLDKARTALGKETRP